MRARNFRPTLGSLESRLSLSGTTGGTGAAIYQNYYEYSANDGGSPGDIVNDPGYDQVCEGPSSNINALNGITIDSVTN